MKKIKKVFMCILSMMMLMTAVPLAAFAAGETVDVNKDVSLTIHKYEYNGTVPKPSTGTENDGKNLPDGAKALAGVTFTVYKVADIVQENGTITYKPVKAITDADSSITEITAGMNTDAIKAFFTEKILTALSAKKIEKTTGIDGIAAFSKDDLVDGQGLYLVMETDAPAAVTQKTDPFLVSLPMTNVTEDGWLYDVHVFPKNKTTKAAVTLKKLGQIGNNTAVGTKDAKFVLQKLDNITQKWETQKKNAEGISIGDVDGIITMGNDTITVDNLAPGTYRFVEVKAPDAGYIMDGKTVYEFKIATNGDVTDLTNNKIIDGTLTVTNYQPTVDKDVLKKGGTETTEGDWKDAADYSVGDHVPFRITATVPANIDKLKTFKLVDTMSTGLKMDATDEGSFVVEYYNGTALVTDTGITTVPIYDSASNTWTFDLKDDTAALKAKGITSIIVKFTATLTQEAVTSAPGVNGNYNTIGLEYSNKVLPDNTDPDNPNQPQNPDNPDTPYDETITITDKVVVCTFGMELIKKFQDGTPSAAINATFDLYRPAVIGEIGSVKIKLENGTEADVVKVGTYTTDENGKITINTGETGTADMAFSNGTYYFVETKTADGYNLLKHPVKVNVEIYYKATTKTVKTIKKYNKNGNLIGTETVVEESGKDETTYYKDEICTQPVNADTNNPDMPVTINVVNKKGFTLPLTGGMGILMFSVIGIGLIAGGAVLLVRSK